MGSCINLLLSQRRDFIPSKYLVRSVITTVLPLSAFRITRSLHSTKFFSSIDSPSDNFFFKFVYTIRFQIRELNIFEFVFLENHDFRISSQTL